MFRNASPTKRSGHHHLPRHERTRSAYVRCQPPHHLQRTITTANLHGSHRVTLSSTTATTSFGTATAACVPQQQQHCLDLQPHTSQIRTILNAVQICNCDQHLHCNSESKHRSTACTRARFERSSTLRRSATATNTSIAAARATCNNSVNEPWNSHARGRRERVLLRIGGAGKKKRKGACEFGALIKPYGLSY